MIDDVSSFAASVDTPESRKRGPPVANPGLSFWQQTTRTFKHLHSRRDEAVASSSPYVVIGSGIAGALLTYELIQGGVAGKDIVLLEAREAASGASSRNAGHVRPDAFRGFELYSHLHGKDQALKILKNERVVLERVRRFVEANRVPCDFNYTSTFECCMTAEFADHARRNYQAFKAAGGDVSHVKHYVGEEETRKQTGIAGVLEAYEWPAGSSHPAKLAQWLLTAVVEQGVRFYTHCPVSKVVPSGRDAEPWAVETGRGTITTGKVVYCTNAFTGHLLPHLAAHIVPYRGQAHAIVPVAALASDKALTKTYSLRYSLNHYYSIIQRCHRDGTIILGCSLPNPALPETVVAGIRTIDDASTAGFNGPIKDDAWAHFTTLFPQAGFERANHGEGFVHAWNGIVGLSSDEVPFLGPVEGKPGQFVCAGFNGHGMARIFTCAPGVAKLVLGQAWADTGLPECFQVSEQRLRRRSNGMKVPSKI